MFARYNVKRILVKARSQNEGMKKRPEVAEGLPYPILSMDELIAKVDGLKAEQENAKRHLVAVTDALHLAAQTLADAVQRNIAGVIVKSGRTSQDLAVVAGVPARLRRPRPSTQAKAPAGETASDPKTTS